MFDSLDKNPDAPIAIWLQGGPGSSSLYGAFQEIGAFSINADGIYNRNEQFNWNQNMHLLIIDNPVGVGYSFSESSNWAVTDQTMVGSDLYKAMQEFYRAFPHLRANDLYITGESYAGKYIPALGSTIVANNEQVDDELLINLKGVSIGDGAMNPPVQFSDFGNLLYERREWSEARVRRE